MSEMTGARNALARSIALQAAMNIGYNEQAAQAFVERQWQSLVPTADFYLQMIDRAGFDIVPREA